MDRRWIRPDTGRGTIAMASNPDPAFPILTPAQIARVAARGRARRIPPGDIVYDAGKPVAHFLVLTAGHIEVVQPMAAGGDLPIVVHGPGAFTGEVNMLSG